MFAQSLPSQQGSLFSVECTTQNDNTDGDNSTGSWETTYSADEALLMAPVDLVTKGAGADIGSPMSHLYAFERASSAPIQADTLNRMASITLDDSHAFLPQVAMTENQTLGWGGRPLQQQQHAMHPHRMRMKLADYGTGPMQDGRPHPQPSGMAMHPHQHPRHQQPPHPGDSRGGNRNSYSSNGAQNRNNRRGNGNRGSQVNVQPQNNNNNGYSSTAQADARGPKGQSYRRLWQQVTSVNRGGHLSGDGRHRETTVEDLLDVVRLLRPEASAVNAVADGLHCLDSGALAALLKELNKAGHAVRAQEIFDWLRSLEPTNDLYALCNTMTYTTMISQCGSQQALRRALELVAEMRSRGVQCNVHTYSALMNVCIKANELDLAIDVYRQMQAEGCKPNLVTYNTLIDVYGKTGAWEDAVAVLDALEGQGIAPEVRTYNTVIIACNQSSQAAQALHVYERMLAAGAKPTATTYTALISAYGKAGQLDAALQIFQDMVARGCERNVITYSSLISACEKAGCWELALKLFGEMHVEGCRPNVVTFNSLIAACAQGAQWERAQALFEQMQGKGCRPDSVTFGGLIAAFDHAGLWQRALTAFEQMRNMNCRPDTVVYNTVIGALWKTGLVWAQTRATQIFHGACRQGHFRMTVHTHQPGGPSTESSLGGGGGSSLGSPTSSGTIDAAALFRMGSGLADELFGDLTGGSQHSDNLNTNTNTGGRAMSATSCCSQQKSPVALTPIGNSSAPASPMQLPASAGEREATIEFGMHAFTVGSAALSLLRWISELRDRLPWDSSRVDPRQSVALVLNKGKPSREHTYPAIRDALTSMLLGWQAPLELADVTQGCRIEGATADVVDWLKSPLVDRALALFSSRSESPSRGTMQRDSFFHEDSMVEGRCTEAFAAVRRFEMGCTTTPLAPTTAAATQPARLKEYYSTAQMILGTLGYSDEVLYDGLLLVDRVMHTGAAEGKELSASPTAIVAACLNVAARQAGELFAAGSLDAAGLQPGEAEVASAEVRSILDGDTSSISSVRVLKLYLERLGGDFVSGSDELWAVGGAALDLLPSAICDCELRQQPPSTVAAAVLLAGRRAAGHTPFWPTTLAALTGLYEGEGSVLSAAAERAAILA